MLDPTGVDSRQCIPDLWTDCIVCLRLYYGYIISPSKVSPKTNTKPIDLIQVLFFKHIAAIQTWLHVDCIAHDLSSISADMGKFNWPIYNHVGFG